MNVEQVRELARTTPSTSLHLRHRSTVGGTSAVGSTHESLAAS